MSLISKFFKFLQILQLNDIGEPIAMEPLDLRSISSDVFGKTCYICEENGQLEASTIGACLLCNFSSDQFDCETYFHVTCGQQRGLLCEITYGLRLECYGYCEVCRFKLESDKKRKFLPAYNPNKQSKSSPKKSRKCDEDTETMSNCSYEYRKVKSNQSEEHTKTKSSHSKEHIRTTSNYSNEYRKVKSNHSEEHSKTTSSYSEEHTRTMSNCSSEYRNAKSNHSEEHNKTTSDHSNEYRKTRHSSMTSDVPFKKKMIYDIDDLVNLGN